MRPLVYTLLLCFISLGLSAQARSTLIRSFPNDAELPLLLCFSGQVSVTEWEQNHIRVTTIIEIENFDEPLLKRLIAAGRYSVEADTQNGKLRFTMPKIDRIVRIQNTELKELIRYEVQVPKGQAFEQQDPNAASF